MKFYISFGVCFITKPSSSSWVLLVLTVRTDAVDGEDFLGDFVASLLLGFFFQAGDFDIHKVCDFSADLADDIEVFMAHKIIIGGGVIGPFDFGDKTFFQKQPEIVVDSCQAHTRIVG